MAQAWNTGMVGSYKYGKQGERRVFLLLLIHCNGGLLIDA
jgi:hypothetical protein